jgi:hypothetical protein
MVPEQGPFPPPELPGFAGTTGPSAICPGRPCPSRDGRSRSRQPSRLASRSDFPCCVPSRPARAATTYPGGPEGCVCRSLRPRRRSSPLLWQVDTHNGVSGPAQCSQNVAARAVADPQKGPFLGVLQLMSLPREPPRVLPAGATVCRAGSLPPQGVHALARRTQQHCRGRPSARRERGFIVRHLFKCRES